MIEVYHWGNTADSLGEEREREREKTLKSKLVCNLIYLTSHKIVLGPSVALALSSLLLYTRCHNAASCSVTPVYFSLPPEPCLLVLPQFNSKSLFFCIITTEGNVLLKHLSTVPWPYLFSGNCMTEHSCLKKAWATGMCPLTNALASLGKLS